MSGTTAGGKKAAKRNIELYGADYYSRMGKIGGKKGTGHAFAHGKVSPSEAGKIGGQVSKRGKVTA